MAVPTYVGAGSLLAGSDASTANIPAPAGTVEGSLVIVVLHLFGAGSAPPTVSSVPAGFELATNGMALTGSSGTTLRSYVYLGREAANTGTYNFGLSGTTYRTGQAFRFSGVVASGNPLAFGSVNATTDDVNAAPPVSGTTATADCLLFYTAANWAGGSWTPPSGFTERADNVEFTVATREWPTPGATGSVSATCSDAERSTAWLGAILPLADEGGDEVEIVGSADLGGLTAGGALTRRAHLAGTASLGGVTAAGALGRAPAYAARGNGAGGGNGSSLVVPTVAGITATSIVLIFVYYETGSITGLPSGFAHAPGSPVVNNETGGAHRLAILWARGPAAGPWTVTFSGTTYRSGRAVRIEGVRATGSPWETDSGGAAVFDSDTQASGAALGTTTLTTRGPDRLMTWAAANFWGDNNSNNVFSPPTGYTERFESDDPSTFQVHTFADATAATAGLQTASGATVSTTDGGGGAPDDFPSSVWLAALRPVPVLVPITGAADLGGVTAAGALGRRVAASGVAPLGGLTAVGELTRRVSVEGATSLGGITAAGVLARRVALAGGAPLGGLAASGTLAEGDEEGTPIGAAVETDESVALGQISKNKAISSGAESDASVSVAALKSRELGSADEIDIARPLTPVKSRTLGVASESDTAVSLVETIAAQLVPAVESDTAVPIAGITKNKAIGTATEADFAVALGNSFAPSYILEPLPYGPGDIYTFVPTTPELGLPADEIIDALLAGVVWVTRRVEIYESDAITPFNIPNWDQRLVEGTINVDRERDERRIIDITLDNSDGALQINPENGMHYDKILKAFWGIKYFDSYGSPRAYEVQVGEFMIDSMTEDRFPLMLKITGRDYTKKCLGSALSSSVVFPAGTPVEDIVRALAANAGITKFALPVTGQTYNLDTVFQRGKSRWGVMTQVAASIGYEVYFRGDGYLAMRPYPDPTYSPLTWIFQGGENDGSLVTFQRATSDALIKNKITVTGSTSEDPSGLTTTVYAEAVNNDPASPTSVQRIGERVDSIQSDIFTDVESAQAFADARLAISALEQYELNFESVVIPWLEASDIIGIDQRRPNEFETSPFIPNRFLLSNFTLSLGLGTMTGQGKRVTIVGSRRVLEFQ